MSNTEQKTDARRIPVSFMAIDSYVETHIVAPTETIARGTDGRYRWGQEDKYPAYLMGLYDDCTTLRSVIDGCVDFIAGDDVIFEGVRDRKMNGDGENIVDVVRQAAFNLKLYGGFALEIIRAVGGGIAEIRCLDLKNIRTNKKNDVFWYSEKWGSARCDYEEIPLFMAEEDQKRSLLFVKMGRSGIYPAPCFAAAVKACEIERNIDDFHLSNMQNGFTASAVVSFNNGPAEDQQEEEIEKNFNEKFSGHSNAGRIIFAWASDKDHAVTVEQLKAENFGEQYEALAKRSRQAIFTAFRANPTLFGIPTESLGFSSEEYEAAFKLFNRTQVRPCQKLIADAFAKIYGSAVLQIVPFTLDGNSETVVN